MEIPRERPGTKDKQPCLQSQNSVLPTTLSWMGFKSGWTFCPEKGINNIKYHLGGDAPTCMECGKLHDLKRLGQHILLTVWTKDKPTALVGHQMLPQMLLSALWNPDLSRACGCMKSKRTVMIIVRKQLSGRRTPHLYQDLIRRLKNPILRSSFTCRLPIEPF